MNATIKAILVISAKNAVNAIITNAGLMALFSNTFHLHNWTGLWHVAEATLSIVAGREATIWVPKIIKWSRTNADPDVV